MIIKISIFLLLCHVIYSDVAKRKIFNFSILLFFLLSLLCKIYFMEDGWRNSFLAMGCVFFFFLIFYVLRIMGAGDVKFGAVLAFFVGLEMFFCIYILSVLMTFVFFIFNFAKRIFSMDDFAGNLNLLNSRDYINKSPYGAFMSISALFLILLRGWNG